MLLRVVCSDDDVGPKKIESYNSFHKKTQREMQHCKDKVQSFAKEKFSIDSDLS